MEDLLSLTRKICLQKNFWPQKKHGQNFLIDESAYQVILEAANLKKTDTVLEVGPGLGFLTERLARSVKKVIAVEIDEALYSFLPERFDDLGINNIELVNEDILHLTSDFAYDKIVANLPYNISAHFLRNFLSKKNPPKELVLMLQKEVVERICAKPPKMSILSISVQYYAEPTLVAIVPRASFWPEPKVDSAIVKIVLKDKPFYHDASLEKKFFQLVKCGFSSRRKMLKNNLAGAYQISQVEAEKKLSQAGIANSVRAQELSLVDWHNLLGTFL
jgi:16S rRNA (adenine1518-N6/adenine1519-N6)-dimethyltransferase